MLNSPHAYPTQSPSIRQILVRSAVALCWTAALPAVAAPSAAEQAELVPIVRTVDDAVEIRFSEPVPYAREVALDATTRVVVPAGEDGLRIRRQASPLPPLSPPIVTVDRVGASPTTTPVPTGCDLDWRSIYGTAQNNGVGASVGPGKPRLRWNGSRPSIIAWPVLSDGKMVFTVRQASFSEPGGSLIVAVDRTNGEEVWAVDIPHEEGQRHIWLAGVRHGKVYASRSNGGPAANPGKLYALSANDGGVLWESRDTIDASPRDGVVFASNGDLIVGSYTALTRIRASDGQTVWQSPRDCSNHGSCGAALALDQRLYIADIGQGGYQVVRHDVTTGQRLYDSDPLPGGIGVLQNIPFVGPEGTVYLAKTSGNPADALHALDDLGSSFALRWSRPSEYVPLSRHATAGDGTLYMIAPGNELIRVDAKTGALLNSGGVLPNLSRLAMTVDVVGKLFVTDGPQLAADPDTLFGFDADLTLRWTEVFPGHSSGPTLAADGRLFVSGTGGELRAYKNARSAPACP